MFRAFEIWNSLKLVEVKGVNTSVASSESAKGSMLMPPASANFNKTFSWNLEMRMRHFFLDTLVSGKIVQ